VETNNVLSNHKFDIIKGKKSEQKHQNKSKPKEDKDEEEVTPLSFAQMEGKCYCAVENRDASLLIAEAKRKFRERNGLSSRVPLRHPAP
jgi:hypothetical protein